MSKWVITIFFTLYSIAGFCQNSYFVRNGATGTNNGADWTNAYIALPASLERGAIYYIADGEYGSYTFDDAEDGDKYITIRKATSNDHGSEAGWNNEYGDGQAIFTDNLHFRNSYYVFDGVTGEGRIGSTYGFRLQPSSCDQAMRLLSIPGWPSIGSVHYIEIRHVEIENCGSDYDYTQTCIYGPAENTSHIIIANNYMHNAGHMLTIRGWKYCIIENNYMINGWSSSANHGEAISEGGGLNITIRNNYFENIEGTAYCNFGKGIYGYSDSIFIYNNVHVSTSDFTGTIGNGAYGMETGEVMRYFEVHHNTFVGIHGIGFGSGIYAGTGTNNKAYNNIWYNCDNPWIYAETGGSIEHDYNSFYNCTGNIETEPYIDINSINPFVDSESFDFRLAQSTASGLSLESPYNVDFIGITRGTDGVWDRGAYEYDPLSSYIVGLKKKVTLPSVFPNPAANIIFIELNTYTNSKSFIKVFNSMGQLVKMKTVEPNQRIIEMDVSELIPGLHYFTVNSDSNNYTGKFIKD